MHKELKAKLSAIEKELSDAIEKAPEGQPVRHALAVKVRGKLRTAIEIVEQDEQDAAEEAKPTPAAAPVKQAKEAKSAA